MPRIVNPTTIVKPASRYAQGIVHRAAAERLLISGQVGIAPDGAIEPGLEAQMQRCWSNLFAVLADAGFAVSDLVKITVLMTPPGDIALYRGMRDRMLDGHLCATTFMLVAGLAHPDLLVEIEGEAVREA
jgi:enamine deaminase RidA (YjgF/YER057c/UK114 family)